MMRASAMIFLAALGAEPPVPSQLNEAIAIGRTCSAPIMRLQRPGGDFDVYIESPLARIALFAATAQQMHLPFDAATAARHLTTTTRIWADYSASGRRTIAVTGILVATSHPRTISQPIAVGTSRLFLGRAASHGIIEGLRFRAGESTFDTLPSGNFTIILQTTGGVRRYPVTEGDRARLLHVCNER
jgi:hypothetical protein